MDEVLDHVSVRVSLAGCLGGLSGIGTALHRGTPFGRTVGLTALSCAAAGTACFSAERVANAALLSNRGKAMYGSAFASTGKLTNNNDDWIRTLTSHAFGGFAGGTFLGTLYGGKPWQGALFFTPLMLLAGTLERLFEDVRQERIQEMIQQQQEQLEARKEKRNRNND